MLFNIWLIFIFNALIANAAPHNQFLFDSNNPSSSSSSMDVYNSKDQRTNSLDIKSIESELHQNMDNQVQDCVSKHRLFFWNLSMISSYFFATLVISNIFVLIMLHFPELLQLMTRFGRYFLFFDMTLGFIVSSVGYKLVTDWKFSIPWIIITNLMALIYIYTNMIA